MSLSGILQNWCCVLFCISFQLAHDIICPIADNDHFGHVIKVVFARLHIPFLISILWMSALNHVGILLLIKLCIHLSIISIYLYLCICILSLLPFFLMDTLLSSVLVFHCCCNKHHKLGLLKQHKFIVLQFCVLEVLHASPWAKLEDWYQVCIPFGGLCVESVSLPFQPLVAACIPWPVGSLPPAKPATVGWVILTSHHADLYS